MTINNYLDGLPKMAMNDGRTLRETMADSCEIWSNDACKGYAILAMRAAGLKKPQIKKVLQEMRWTFDEVSIEKAEQAYIDF